MTEITKQFNDRDVRVLISDGEIFLSVRDLGKLIRDNNPGQRLKRAGVPTSRYCRVSTPGGTQRMRFASINEIRTILPSMYNTELADSLSEWLDDLTVEICQIARDFCGGR